MMYKDLITAAIDYDQRPYRNIKSIREPQNLFDDLAEDENDLPAAIVADTLSRPESSEPVLTRPFDYGIAITFPFLQENWHQTRFSDGRLFGVWYGAEELETTVYETVFHWRAFLLDAFSTENRLIRGERRVFRVRCQGVMIDLRGKEQEWPALIDRSSYQFTQDLGRYLNKQRQNGLLAVSARCRGQNVAAFTPDILADPVDVCYLGYAANPVEGPEVYVEKASDCSWMVLDGSSLI